MTAHQTLVDGVHNFLHSVQHIEEGWAWCTQVGLTTAYELADPFVTGMYLVVAVSTVCFLLGLITRNYSHVDRIWSLIPLVYCWHFTLHCYLIVRTFDVRLTVMSGLVTLWGIRLSYNFWRKGGYNFSEEDYRWPELRKIIRSRVLFELFNLTFIAFYQNLLLYLITLPIYYAYLSITVEWNSVDWAATAAFLFFLLLETISDEQQWAYQTTKWSLINANKPLKGKYKVGFNHVGLFRYSRHPNFLGEMCIWWAFYAFSLCHAPAINQSIVGTILLTLLFQGSTLFTEAITCRKYPQYAEYQKTTSRFIPLSSSFTPPYDTRVQ